jgi:hypothetical protein
VLPTGIADIVFRVGFIATNVYSDFFADEIDPVPPILNQLEAVEIPTPETGRVADE